MLFWTSASSSSGVAAFVCRIKSIERDEFRGGHITKYNESNKTSPNIRQLSMGQISLMEEDTIAWDGPAWLYRTLGAILHLKRFCQETLTYPSHRHGGIRGEPALI